MKILLLTLILAIVPSAFAGEIYRCSDQGTSRLSDRRIAGQRCDVVQSWVERDPAYVDATALPIEPAAFARPAPQRAPPKPTKPRILDATLDATIRTHAQRWRVDESLVRAVIHAESSFNPRAVSPKGAMGLMQLMPATARRFGVSNAFDPYQNIAGGVQYLAWLLNRYKGDWRLAVAGYNAGEGAVDKYSGVPPYRETRDYLNKVWSLSQSYGALLRK